MDRVFQQYNLRGLQIFDLLLLFQVGYSSFLLLRFDLELVLAEHSHYDLVISNYAISEIDRAEQLHYFAMILDQAERGYIIYNHFPQINPFSIDAFFSLLRKNHKKITIIREDPRIIGNIIIWHQ